MDNAPISITLALDLPALKALMIEAQRKGAIVSRLEDWLKEYMMARLLPAHADYLFALVGTGPRLIDAAERADGVGAGSSDIVPVAATDLLAESLAVFDLMLEGCREQNFGDFQNGDGIEIGPRMDALHGKLRAFDAGDRLATPTVHAPTQARMSQRESFEHWYSDEGKSPRAIERSGEGYVLAQAQSAWTAWKACYKALDITGRPSGQPEYTPTQAQTAADVERDAARYRWLRDRPEIPDAAVIDVAAWENCEGTALRGAELDSAIDLAAAQSVSDGSSQ